MEIKAMSTRSGQKIVPITVMEVLDQEEEESLVTKMNRGDALPRSVEHIRLCDSLAEMISTEDHESVDIEEWAKKLAGDLSRFSD